MSLSDLKPAHFIQSRVHVHCAAAHSAVVEGGGILVEVVTKWEEGERERGRGERGARGGHLRGALGLGQGGAHTLLRRTGRRRQHLLSGEEGEAAGPWRGWLLPAATGTRRMAWDRAARKNQSCGEGIVVEIGKKRKDRRQGGTNLDAGADVEVADRRQSQRWSVHPPMAGLLLLATALRLLRVAGSERRWLRGQRRGVSRRDRRGACATSEERSGGSNDWSWRGEGA